MPGYDTATDETSDEDHEDDDDTADDTDNCMDSSVFTHLPAERNSCFVHTLQLVVHDGFKQAGPQISKLVAKTSKIVSFARKSTLATDILEGEKCLQAANATRWNSQLRMIRSIVNVPSDKLDALDTVHLSQYERNSLRDLCDILKPLESVTIRVQEEKGVSASLVVPCVRGLKLRMRQISSTYNSKFVLALRESIEKRLTPFENDLYSTASAVDSRFKLQWCCSEIEKSTMKQLLISNCEHVAKNVTAAEQPPEAKRQRVAEPDDIFDFMNMEQSQTSSTSSATTEVTEYLSQPCTDRHSNPLQYWKANCINFPILTQLVPRYLNIPVSSAPVQHRWQGV